MKSNWIVRLLVVIGALWLLLQVSFLPTLIFFLVAAVILVLLLFVLGAAAIPGLIFYGIGRALGIFGEEDKPEKAGRTIDGQAEPVEAQWQEADAAAPPTPPPPTISGRMRGLIDQHRGALSEPVITRLEAILNLVEDLEAVLDSMDRGSEQYYTVTQTAESYVPEMLENYLKLPTDFARNHKLQNGQTPRELLVDQLDILNNELTALRDAAYEQKTEDLIAHGEFLKQKFEKPKSFLDLP